MPFPGEIVSFDGFPLGAAPLANVTGILDAVGTEPVNADPQYLERPGHTATFVQSFVPATTFTVTFTTPSGADRGRLLRVLNYPHTNEPKPLRAYLGEEGDETLCELPVAVNSIAQGVSSLIVSFMSPSAIWKAVDPVTLSDLHTVTMTGALTHVLENAGHVRAQPTYKLSWSAQHGAQSADLGWQYRRQITVTNDTDEDWHDQPMCVQLGDTAAWVTGSKALSTGNDVRVWYEGRDLARTLVCFNTLRSLVWFLVTIPAGESNTYDVMYGNDQAGEPTTLSARSGTQQTYIAPDLQGESGTLSTGSTSTATDASKSWETDQWQGAYFIATSGTGSVRARRVLSNTGTVLTLNRTLATAVDNTTKYVMWKSGIIADGGRVNSATSTTITDTQHTIKFPSNGLEGATVTFHGGTASPSTMTVLSSTSDTLTFTGSFSANPSSGDSYTIERGGMWSYMVDESIENTLHRGLYRVNRFYSKPSRVWANGDTIGGWQFATYLPDKDDYSIVRPYDKGSGGGHNENWWGTLRSRRRQKQNKTYKHEGNGDGLSIYVPFGFQSIYFDWRVKNINGVGKIVLATMEPGGEDWADAYTYTTTQATLTAISAQTVDLSQYDNPTRLYMGVLPAGASDDDAEIPATAAPTDEVEVRTYEFLELYFNLDAFGDLTSGRSSYVVGSESEVYDLAVTLRIGGGNTTDLAAPYDLVQLGGSAHKIAILETEELWITTDPAIGRPLFGVYSTLSGEIEEAVPWAGKIYRYRKDYDDNDVAVQAMEFLPLPPATNLVENGDFAENDVSMWSMTPGVGVTAAKSWVSTPNVGGSGAMQIDITVTPVGAWDIELVLPQIDVLPNHAYPFGFWRRTDDNGNSVDATMYVVWGGGVSGDNDQDVGGAFAANDTWYHDADENNTYYVPPGMVGIGPSVDTADIRIVISGTGSYTGKVFIDRVTLGVPAIHISETDMGTLTFDAVWEEGLLS